MFLYFFLQFLIVSAEKQNFVYHKRMGSGGELRGKQRENFGDKIFEHSQILHKLDLQCRWDWVDTYPLILKLLFVLL